MDYAKISSMINGIGGEINELTHSLDMILTSMNERLYALETEERATKELERRIHSLEIDFIHYAETNPKTSIQWTEERLRALEAQIKRLKETKLEYKPFEDVQIGC